MHKGIVKFFNKSKGYGFIISGDREIYVHRSFLERSNERDYLVEGEEVTFDLYEGIPHYKALNVETKR